MSLMSGRLAAVGSNLSTLAGWLSDRRPGGLANPGSVLAGYSGLRSWLAGSCCLAVVLVRFVLPLSLIPPVRVEVGPAGIEPATQGL